MDNELLETDVVLRLARSIGELSEASVAEASAAECRLLAERLSDAFVLCRWSSEMASAVLRRIVVEADPDIDAVDVQDDVDGDGSVHVAVSVHGEWHDAGSYNGFTPEVQETILNVARISVLGKRGW